MRYNAAVSFLLPAMSTESVQHLQDDVLANSFNIYRGDNQQL